MMLRTLGFKRVSILSILLLCAVIIVTCGPCCAQNLQEFSQEFRNLAREIQRLYLEPRGWSLRAMESETPSTVAAVMGHALRQQAVRLGPDYAMDGRYLKLEDEVFYYLSLVAQRAGYVDEHGNSIAMEDLWDIAYYHLDGNRDSDIEEFFGVKTGQMASVLGAPAGDPYVLPEIEEDDEMWPPPGPPAGIEFQEEEDQSTLNLLGVTLDEPTTVPGEEDLDLRGPARKWKYDDIIGTWQCMYATLRVTKQGDKYIGVCTGAPDPVKAEQWFGWRVGEKAFEVEPGYRAVGGPVYEGLGWHSTDIYKPPSWGKAWPMIVVSKDPALDSLRIWDVTNGDTYLHRAGR